MHTYNAKNNAIKDNRTFTSAYFVEKICQKVIFGLGFYGCCNEERGKYSIFLSFF